MSTPTNLPAELTSFVGREPQLAELRRLLRRSRLITLTGPGGVGKTRLALRLVSGVVERFPGGAWLVELAALGDPLLLERAVATACRIRESERTPITELLLERLSGPQTLIVFDGAEHLIDACRTLGERLLRGARTLTLLVTSREPLGISGELIWRTPPLTVPATPPAVGLGLMQSEAVRLFLDRAHLARPDFVVSRAGEADVIEICTRLEGLPLAIELAAGLANAMSVREIRSQLGTRSRLLTGGRGPAASRRRTLRTAIDWSYHLLTEDEQRLFSQLAVFAGGFDLDAAEAVGANGSADAIPTLMRLVDKSLVVAEPRPNDRTRYGMLDTIREYAADWLDGPASMSARERHAAHFLAFAQKAAAELLRGDQALWLDRIEEESANLRLALATYELASPGQMIELTRCLSRYWYVRGKFSDAIEWFDKSVAVSGADPSQRMSALQSRARFRRLRGDYEGSRRDATECAGLARDAHADLHLMGALVTLGNLSASEARWTEAARFFSEVLEVQRRIGDPGWIGTGLNNLALVESSQGNHEQAKRRIDEALEAVEQVGDRILRASIHESAGRIERRRGDRRAARTHYVLALELSSEFEDATNIADVLDGMSLLAIDDRDPKRALVLAAGSAAQRAAAESNPPDWDQVEVVEAIARARSLMPRAGATAAWRRGSAMTLREAVAYAKGTPPDNRTKGGLALTGREMQVASLIAEGVTNGEIAIRLKMAERTADAHVEHIRNKLGLHTRSQIAIWAHEKLVRA
ncbi:MAG TPA: tetratricopeptide repeat protein [Candidatus Dormibacteraeota bacterium]